MAVSAQNIEHELASLWKTEDDEAKALGLQRLYTTNLVAYAWDNDEGYLVEKVLNSLVGYHPGPYILVRAAADTREHPLRPPARLLHGRGRQQARSF